MKISLKSLVTLILIGFLMTNCVTKKKLQESQQIESTRVLDIVDIRTNKAIETLKSDVLETLNKKEQETTKEEKKTDTAHENESINVTGTLEPKEKETSVSVGGTTIKNNGGKVSFEITSSKEYKAERESLIKEFSKVIDEERNARISLENELNEFKTAQLKVNEELKAGKKTQSEESDKKGLSFWMVIIAIVSAILFVAYNIYSKRLF